MSYESELATASIHSRRAISVRDFVLLAAGFGCMIGYTRMLALGFVGYLAQGVPLSTDAWHALRSGVCLALLAVLALGSWRRAFRVEPIALMLSTACAVAAAIVFAVDGSGGCGWVVAVVGGASAAVLMYVWMLLLSAYDIKTIVGVTLVGSVVSAAIILGVPHLDAALALVVAVAAAFVAGMFALLVDNNLESCAPDGPLDAVSAVRVPWLTVVMVLACGFLASVIYGIAEQLTWLYDWSSNRIASGVAITATVGITMYAMVARLRNWAHLVWIPMFALFVLALAFACFSIRESIQIAVGLMVAAVFCTHYLHWAIFPALFSTLHIPRAFLAAVVLVFANGSLATALGDAIGSALPHSMQNLGGVAGIMVIVLGIVLVLAFLMQRQASATNLEPSDVGGDDSGGIDNPLDFVKARIDAFSTECGLTPREEEVAFLTAQGFSCAYIAERLVVSESTVRFHQRNLYRKLDVHSRNELIELVNESPAAGEAGLPV